MKNFIATITVLTCLLPLQAQIRTAQDYYDYITDRQSVVEASLIGFSNALETDSAGLMYGKLKIFKDDCEKMAGYMDDLAPFRGHTAWRDALRDLYIFYYKLCEREYVQLVDYSLRLTQLTELEYRQLADMMNMLTEEENKKVEAVNMAREDFLKKFGPVNMREPKAGEEK